MKITCKIVYTCDHCNKRYFSKYHCGKHETKCSKNPTNDRPCFHLCGHLKEVEVEYYAGYDDYESGEPVHKKGKGFYCALKDELMLPPKILHRYNGEGLRHVYVGSNDYTQKDMPVECSEYTHEVFVDTNIDWENTFKK